MVERLLAAGQLPNLAALRRRGAWARLRNEPPGFLSLVWPSFFNGTRVDEHGWYYGKMWRAEHQRLEYADETWLPQRPFWDDLSEAGVRMALIDVPYSMGAPASFNGVYLNGWQCHDDFGRHVYPAGLWRELVGALRQAVAASRRCSARRRRARCAACAPRCWPASSRPPPCASICWTASGSTCSPWSWAGSIAAGTTCGTCRRSTPATCRRTSGAELVEGNDDLYRAADAAVGPDPRQGAGPALGSMVFALHGMGPNTGWTERFPDLVGQIHRGGPGGAAKTGLLYRVKKALPWELVREVTTRLPTEVNKRLISVWSARMLDWSATRFFALPGRLQRLRARQPARPRGAGDRGPGQRVGRRRGRGRRGLPELRGHRDRRADRRARACRWRTLVGADAPRRAVLPDVMVNWGDRPLTAGIGVRSPRYGELRWERGARFASGRSGNHLPWGWLVAAGPDIEAGVRRPASSSRST